jgi:hypothetical protein
MYRQVLRALRGYRVGQPVVCGHVLCAKKIGTSARLSASRNVRQSPLFERCERLRNSVRSIVNSKISLRGSDDALTGLGKTESFANEPNAPNNILSPITFMLCKAGRLPADDDLTFRVNAVNLENRLGDIETDCRNRHV